MVEAAVVRAELERWNVPGIALGITREGETETAAYGVASLESDVAVTPETRFRIASISKPFTATLALTLVDEGLLAIDEPAIHGRSVRELLSHGSGWASEWPRPLDGYVDLAALDRDDPAPGPADTRGVFSYCNAGFWLLAAAIERAAGMSFEEAMRSRVLDPLGLGATGYDPEPPVADGHDQVAPGADEHRVATGSYPRVRRAGGGLFSTVGDLLRFAAFQLGGEGPLSRTTVGLMQGSQRRAPGGGYGLGWALRRSGARRIVEHWGSALGFQTVLTLVPEEELAFVALTNSSRGGAAIRTLLDDLGLGFPRPHAVRVAAERLAAAAGTYRCIDGELVLAAGDGVLEVDFAEIDPFTGDRQEYPPLHARPIAESAFLVDEGEFHEGIELLRPDLVRFASVLFARA